MLRAGLLLSLIWPTSPPVPRPLDSTQLQQGFAAHYRQNLMQQVSHNRGMPVVACMIAVPDPGHLGEWVTVWSQTTGAVEQCRITDYAHPDDRASIERRGIITEFNLEAARRMCIGVVNYGDESPRMCPILIDWGHK